MPSACRAAHVVVNRMGRDAALPAAMSERDSLRGEPRWPVGRERLCCDVIAASDHLARDMLAEDWRERDTAVRDGHVDIVRSWGGTDDGKAIARHWPEAERETLEGHAAGAGHEGCDAIEDTSPVGGAQRGIRKVHRLSANLSMLGQIGWLEVPLADEARL